jgi:hypothetical protein
LVERDNWTAIAAARKGHIGSVGIGDSAGDALFGRQFLDLPRAALLTSSRRVSNVALDSFSQVSILANVFVFRDDEYL